MIYHTLRQKLWGKRKTWGGEESLILSSYCNFNLCTNFLSFSRIYSLQENGYAYTTVDKLLNSMSPDFTNMTKASISKILLEKGYSHKFLDEFVQSIMMVNYGQTNDISGFVGKYVHQNM